MKNATQAGKAGRKPGPLSRKAEAVMLDIARGRGAWFGAKGQSEHGGRVSVLRALESREYIRAGDAGYALTSSGRAYLERKGP